MADGQDGAGKIDQRLLQDLPRLDVQMVGRFIQEQQIRPFQQQAAQVEAGTLAAAQDGDFLVDIDIPKP